MAQPLLSCPSGWTSKVLCMAPAKFTSPQWLLRKMLCGGVAHMSMG